MAWVPAFEGTSDAVSSSPACAVPGGVAHALDPDTGTVACGRPADGLVVDADLSWPLAGLAAVDVCPYCVDTSKRASTN